MSSITEKLKGLYVITDPQLLPQENLLAGVANALAGGARIVQYRDKPASDVVRLRNAQSLKDLCHDYGALFIVNDDLALCERVGADGVHLGKQDGDLARAKAKMGNDRILGATCHNDFAYAKQAIEQDVDYCAFGRLFPSQTKPNAPHCSLQELAELATVPAPTVAIGGITLANAESVLATKIEMIAVIHGVFGQPDIKAAAQSFSNLFLQSHY